MSQLKLYLFGPPRLEADNEPVTLSLRKAVALISYLGATGQPHSRDALATLFWPNTNQKSARSSLRRLIYDIGQRLEVNLLEATSETIGLNQRADLWVDVQVFRQQAQVGLTSSSQLEALLVAANLHVADFMAGFTLKKCLEFDDWQFFQREELRQTLAQVLILLIDTYETDGDYDAAQSFARKWLALDPLHEPAHRQLMRLYALADQHAAALRQFEECVRILDEDLGIPPEEETTALFEAIRTRKFSEPDLVNTDVTDRRASPAKATANPTWKSIENNQLDSNATNGQRLPNNLPIQPTPFVGRVQEVADIIDRLIQPTCRLLTLVGPGGIGKTRLSLATAETLTLYTESTSPEMFRQIQQRFKDGVFFVSLQPVATASTIPSAIAKAIGFSFSGLESTAQQLVNYLQLQRILIILDNFEHLLDGVDLISEILVNCPQIALLATSREALNLREEWFHPIAGMRYSIATQDGTAVEIKDAERVDAVKLFTQHAVRVDPNFRLDNHLTSVIHICQMVDGMPLAIELAASWLKVLDIDNIVVEMTHGLDILTGQIRNMPERHRSMQVVLDQSWQMLNQPEQQVLTPLSVFRGGFSFEAAQRVADADYHIMAVLVSKSFLQLEVKRYQIHELLRQFIAHKLQEDPCKAEQAQQHHSDYYFEFLAVRQPMINGPKQQEALNEIGVEIDNIRTAWQHGVRKNLVTGLIKSLQSLYEFYMLSSRFEEAYQVFNQAILNVEEQVNPTDQSMSERLLGTLLVYQGGIATHVGKHEEAALHLARAQALPISLREKARSFRFLSDVAMADGDSAETEAILQAGLELSREIDDKMIMIHCLNGLSICTAGSGEFERGREFALESLSIARELGRPDQIGAALSSLAWACNCVGAYEEADLQWQETLAHSKGSNDLNSIATTLNFLGWNAWSQGGDKLEASKAYHEEALTLLRKLNSRSFFVMALADYGLVMNELGEFETTVQCCTEGMTLAEALNMPMYVGYNSTVLGVAQAGLGNISQGINQICKSVQIELEIEQLPQCLIALYFLMLVLNRYGKQQAELDLTDQQIMGVIKFVIQHPSTYQPIRDRAKILLIALETTQPANYVSTDTELTLDDIASMVLVQPE